jgi:hypothetical protein
MYTMTPTRAVLAASQSVGVIGKLMEKCRVEDDRFSVVVMDKFLTIEETT